MIAPSSSERDRAARLAEFLGRYEFAADVDLDAQVDLTLALLARAAEMRGTERA